MEYEQVYIDNLPCCECYEKSYMHRDVITHILVTKLVYCINNKMMYTVFAFWKICYWNISIQVKLCGNCQLRWTCKILEKAGGIDRICKAFSGTFNADTVDVC